MKYSKCGYKFIRGIVHLITHKMNTIWDEPWDGEASVFCPNHAGAMGPIAMVAWFDQMDHCRTWYNDVVIDRKRLPEYVRIDHWWNHESFFHPILNVTVPYLVALFLPWIFKGVPGIPVYHDAKVTKTFRESMEALAEGNSLTIFAQEVDGYQSHTAHLIRGFLMVAPMAWKKLGICLKFYPVHVSTKEHTIHVMKPIAFDPERTLKEQEDELIAYLEKGVWDE